MVSESDSKNERQSPKTPKSKPQIQAEAAARQAAAHLIRQILK